MIKHLTTYERKSNRGRKPELIVKANLRRSQNDRYPMLA